MLTIALQEEMQKKAYSKWTSNSHQDTEISTKKQKQKQNNKKKPPKKPHRNL